MSLGISPSDDRPTVGRQLSRARIDAGLTVDEISTTTRVRPSIVQAIEEDDFSRCGGDFYARGHIRNLARALGVDPEPLVEHYVAEYGGTSARTPVAPLYEAERIRPEPRRPNWNAAMIAAIVAVIGFLGFTVFNGGDSGTSPVAGEPAATKPVTAPATARPGPSESVIAAAPKDKVTVRLTADGGQSWIQAKDSNGKVVYEGTLEQGGAKTLSDETQLSLTVGNAGAVKMFVNGKDLGPAGGAGQVAHLEYTPGDPQAG